MTKQKRFKDFMKTAINGVVMASMDAETNVTLTGGRSNILQGCVRKRTVGMNILLSSNKSGSTYVNMVRRHLANEGFDPSDWEPDERVWGHRLEGTPLIIHNTKMYLEVIILRPGKSTYYVNGKETDPSEIPGLVLKKQEAEQGGIENKVYYRNFNIDSVTALVIAGQRYEMTR